MDFRTSVDIDKPADRERSIAPVPATEPARPSGVLDATSVRVGILADFPAASGTRNPEHRTLCLPLDEVADALFSKMQALDQEGYLTRVVAALVVLLHRYTLQTTIVVGIPLTPYDDERPLQTQRFAVLPLKVSIDPTDSFAAVLTSTETAMRRRLATALAPAEPSDTGVRCEPAGSLLFHAIIFPPADAIGQFDVEIPCFSCASLNSLLCATDLYVAISITSAHPMLTIGFDGTRFSEERIRRIGLQLMQALGNACAHTARPVRDINIIPEAERRELLVDSNGLTVSLPNSTIVDLVEEQCRRSASRIAITCEGVSLTYAEVKGKADTLALELERLGVTRGTIVPLLLDQSFDLIISALGLMKLGAIFVPLDISWPASRLRAMINDLAPRLVLIDEAFRPPFSFDCATLSVNASALPVSSVSHRNRIGPDDPIYGFYTSGSTGTPKCAINIHRGILNRFLYMNKRYGDDRAEVILQNSKHVFDAWVWQIFWPMTNGARVIVPHSRKVFDLLGAIELIDKHKVTMTDFVPSVFNALIDYIQDTDPGARKKLATLKHVLMGGEEMNAEAVYRSRQMLPHCHITNTYGPTETSIGVIFFEVDDKRYTSVPIGRPIDNVSALLLDENLNLVPIGVEGEIYIGGQCVGLGYLNDPLKTRAAFIDNPFSEVASTRLYRTGDLAYRALDGNIQFVGRKDHQVKLHGIRVELGEIETALRACPGVKEAKVLLHKNPGQQNLLVAYVASAKALINVRSVRERLRQQIPGYMVPSRFVVLDAMPVDHNGKIDRKALLAIPLPEESETTHERAATPHTRERRLLSELWRSALGISKVGATDNFFDLGGDSLTAVRVLCGIRERFGVEVPLHRLYASPTITDQLKLIKAVSQEIPLQAAESTSVLSVQADLALADNLFPEHPVVDRGCGVRNVLLTGATGFVGAQLLSEILATTDATVYCLIRARNDEDALRRVDETLKNYRLCGKDASRRIVPIAGNLGLSEFGLHKSGYQDLADRIDTVFHSAAMVDYFRGYSGHRAPNVLGTLEVLRFAAAGHAKRMHHISTLGVFPSQANLRGGKVFGEADFLEDDFFPSDGYSQSKWVAEKLIEKARANGMVVTLFRLGEVMPSTGTGIPNEKAASHRVISGFLKLGVYPKTDTILDYTPVDYVARGIVGIARIAAWSGSSLNLRHSRGLPMASIMETLRSQGLRLREVTTLEFLEALETRCLAETPDLDLLVLKSLLARHIDDAFAGSGNIRDVLKEMFYIDFTRVANATADRALAECEAKFPADEHVLLDAYANYCRGLL